METNQKLWSSFFLFAPAIFIGIKFGLMKGILALIIYVILGLIIGWTAVFIVSPKFMKTWAYMKGPIISGILIFGFYYFSK
jgi:hypothetical protein